jgi:creatinine amidohydrolase
MFPPLGVHPRRWLDAERALTSDAVVLIAAGAASKEHGPHLPLSSDFLQAEYVKERVAERTSVVVAPSVRYGYYPPFAEYPGSTTLPMLLYIAPDLVDMKKASAEYGAASATGGRMIGNRPANSGVFSPSGVFGDPTLATREKGQRLTEAVVAATLQQIDSLRARPLPPAVSLEATFAGVAGLYEVAPGDTIRVARAGDLLAAQRRGRCRHSPHVERRRKGRAVEAHRVAPDRRAHRRAKITAPSFEYNDW